MVPLQRPPLKGSGLSINFPDLPLSDAHTGLGVSGPGVPIQNEVYPPLGDDFTPASPIQGPALHLLDGPVNFPLPGGNSYGDSLSDGTI